MPKTQSMTNMILGVQIANQQKFLFTPFLLVYTFNSEPNSIYRTIGSAVKISPTIKTFSNSFRRREFP